MDELDDFALELFARVPDAEQVIRADGGTVEPDHEVPTVWLGEVGAAVTALPEPAARAALEVVERHLGAGSQAWRDAVCTGLLEALAGAVSAGRMDGRTLATMLGPRSRAYIDAWDEFTLGRSSLE